MQPSPTAATTGRQTSKQQQRLNAIR